jgi:hypothetical protein
VQQQSEDRNLRDSLPKTARLMTVEQVLTNEFRAFEGVEAVNVYPSIPVPNDEKWTSFSAVIEIVRPTGERLRRRARFAMMHCHYSMGAEPPEKPLPFYEMYVILYDVGVDDVPIGSVIFADETVVARLTPRSGAPA